MNTKFLKNPNFEGNSAKFILKAVKYSHILTRKKGNYSREDKIKFKFEHEALDKTKTKFVIITETLLNCLTKQNVETPSYKSYRYFTSKYNDLTAMCLFLGITEEQELEHFKTTFEQTANIETLFQEHLDREFYLIFGSKRSLTDIQPL